MKAIKQTTVLVFILVILSGCIRDVELDLNNTNREYVLNCILNTTRDTLRATLTKTENSAFGNESFETVKDAEIVLFENDKSVGSFSYSDSNPYFLVYKPKPGTTYRLEAHTGNDKIWGETTTPETPVATIEKLASSMEGYQVSLKDNSHENNFYWVTATGFEGAEGNQTKNIACVIYSNFEYADDFNQRIYDNGIFRFEYEYYLRFNDLQLSEQITEIVFRPQCISYPEEVFILSTDYHLDKYMKSSLLLLEMELFAEEMPVIYSPQPVYSNIHGGTGILGSFNSVSKVFAKE